MNIGMILEDYYPEDIRVTKEAKALIKNGFQVYLLCMKRENEKEFEIIDNIKVIRANLPIKQSLKGLFFRAINAFIFNHYLWQKNIENFILKYNINILHIHDLPLFGTANKIAKKYNKKIIIDFHENYPDGLQVWGIWKKDFKNRYIYPILSNYKRWLKFEKFACNQADKVIVVVPEMGERLKKLHNLQKYYVVSNTEDIEFQNIKIDVSIMQKYQNKFIVSYIGGVGYHRGIDTTIKAFNEIKEDIYLLIVGGISKDIKEHLDSITKTNNIIYIGQVPFEKVVSYIKVSDICLVPHNDTAHTNNTIPHKLFQYMLLEKPVIVSDCPPLKRVVKECNCGLVFKRNDYLDLKNKILSIYANNSNFGLNGKRCVENRYNFKNDSDILLKIYREIK